jgi:hypothetical protein
MKGGHMSESLIYTDIGNNAIFKEDIPTFEDNFRKIYNEAFELLCEKQARYGNSNIEQLGLHGVISRIGNDKIARARKFMQGKIVDGQVVLDPLDHGTDESLADTLLDIANYALIAVALQRGLWGAPMERDVEPNE